MEFHKVLKKVLKFFNVSMNFTFFTVKKPIAIVAVSDDSTCTPVVMTSL